jgi:hypothetical protein
LNATSFASDSPEFAGLLLLGYWQSNFRQKRRLQRSHRQVVKALGVGIGKISGALARATAIGLDADGIERLTDAELEAALYPKAVAPSARAVPDCAALHLELRRPR